MTIAQRTSKEISDNIIAQLEASLSQSIPLLPKSFMRVLSKALGGVFILLYKYVGWMILQQFVTRAADADTLINGITVNPLREWGLIYGVGLPKDATRAEHTIDIGVTTLGGTLPAGTPLVSATNGVTYITLTTTSLSAAIVSATVRAAADQAGGGGAGDIGNLGAGAVLSFVNPLGAVSVDAEVTAQTVTGADGETTAAYRQRILDRIQKQPQGGAYADYEQWGEEAAGILNVYPYTGLPGQVNVYSESSTETDGIPTPAQLLAVLDSINLDSSGLATRRPAGSFVNSLPITRAAFDVEVNGLVADNPSQVVADITTELTKFFLVAEPFIAGLSVLPRKDRISSGAVSGVVAQVVFAAGGVYNSVVLRRGGLAVDLYALGEGEKAKLGTVTT